MPVSVGSWIGPYEILAPLGEGGMGLVYRARDAKLARDVAIKVLPEVFADDADRLARFMREAQTLAALNHPNIAHIYGLEEHGGTRALVLELIEGEDLSALIARGPVPVADATPIARQIAEALEAAHELGIVHRDLKPANIMVRADGTVKILDFGLAKAIGATSDRIPSEAMQSPTLTARATAMGIIVGTAAYMAPEQAKGRAVDRRADIWAFGLIVHEMLTGRRLFQADSLPETLAHVISQDIAFDSLPPATPPHLRALVERCVVRDPRLRLRDIGEARLALSGDSTLVSGRTSAIASSGKAESRGNRMREVLAWSIAGILAVVAAIFAWLTPSATTNPPVLRLGFALDAPVSLLGLSIALAPDAHAIVVEAPWSSGDRRLYLRRLDGTALTPLPGTEGGARPVWSPDSRSIAFVSEQRLRRLDLVDGAVREVCRVEEMLQSGAWGASEILMAAASGALHRVAAQGGVPTRLPLDSSVKESRQVNPVFLPDGRRFTFTSIRQDGTAHVMLASLDNDRRAEVPASTPRRIVWAGEDQVVFLNDGVLYAQRISYSTPAFVGEPQAITPGVDVAWLGQRESVAGTGMLAFVEAADRVRQFSWYPRSGGPGRPVGSPGEYLTFDLSHDDRKIVVTQRITNRRNLWILDAERGGSSPFTSGDPDDIDPRWSADGRSVMFGSQRDPGRSPHRALLTGQPPSLVFSFPGQLFALDDWSADGRWVLFHEALEGVLKARLIDPVLRAGETKDQEIVVARPMRGTADQSQMSPDGRWIAFNSNESGRPEVIVVPFPPTGEKVQVSRNGGVQPVWRRDGGELFFLALDGTLMASKITKGGTFTASEPTALFTPRVQPVMQNVEQYAVSADGTRVLVLERPADAKPPVVQVIANWTRLLDRPRVR